MNTLELPKLLREVFPQTQDELAELTGLGRATISLHLIGKREISASQIGAYLRAAPPVDRPAILSAWLRRYIPNELHGEIFHSSKPHQLAEPVASYRPSISDEFRRALDYLAGEAAADPELESVFLAFIRRMGWEG